MWYRAILISLAIVLLTFVSVEPELVHANQEQCENFDFSAEEIPHRISADRIVAAAGSGCEIQVQGAVIEGDVNFFWKRTFEEKVTFRNTTFEGDLDFRYSTFMGEVEFSSVTFSGETDFSFSTFEGRTGFVGIVGRTTFEKQANFYGVTFKDNVSLGHLLASTEFQQRANFGLASFKGDAGFGRIQFYDESHFSDTIFEGRVDFSGANFEDVADFTNAIFEADAEFSSFLGKASFRDKADFRFATFEGEANFKDVVFDELVDFSSSFFAQKLIFFPQGNMKIIPPGNATIIDTNLNWMDVKYNFPEKANTIEMYGSWEEFFIASGKYSEARQVRTARTRHELISWFKWISAISLMAWFLFTLYYFRRFPNIRRSHLWWHIGKVLLFSLDVISPSIRPWKYDWERDGGFSVRRVAAATTVESAIGWLLLAVFSAVLVAWLVA